MAISRILSGRRGDRMIIYLSRISPRARRIFIRRDATIPEDFKRAGCPSSVLSCTAWGFSCLANCFASGELLPRLFTLARALLPKNQRYLFCDTLRHASFSTVMPACFTRHAAVWCSDFPPASKGLASDHLPSANNLSQPARKKREPRITRIHGNPKLKAGLAPPGRK
jgi:hypothetical protein